MKILRFGIDDDAGGLRKNNRQDLHEEIGDLLAVIGYLELDDDLLKEAISKKVAKLAVYGPDGTYLKDKG